MDTVKEMIERAHEEIAIYPIWLCPARFVKYDDNEHANFCKWGKNDCLVDVGFYG